MISDMKGNIIIKNATIVTPLGKEAAKGNAMSKIATQRSGCIIITEGTISYAGPEEGRPMTRPDEHYEVLDAKGCVALPGFVDSHTHLIFGGFRPDEFQWRLQGDSYMSIMERGGGIQSTVNSTRETSKKELKKKAQWFIDRMSEMGVTTVEAKS